MDPLEAVSSTESLQKIIDVIASPIFVKDRDHRWVIMNDAMCRFMGLPKDRLIGRSDFDIVPSEEAAVFWAIDDRVFATGEDNENEEQHTDVNGHVRTIVTRKRLVHVSGDVPLLVAVITDITDFREAEAHSRYLATHDTLSGLPNRGVLNERIDFELAQLRREPGRCALLHIDLDGFKSVNDRYGHPAGDEVIREFGSRVCVCAKGADIVARIGGDELAVLISDVGSEDEVEVLCRAIIDCARLPFDVSGITIYVDASIGVVFAGPSDMSGSDLLRKADVAHQQAKAEGGGRFRIYAPSMDDGRRRRQQIECELRAALDGEPGLEVCYQPIYSNVDEHVTAVEALVRWTHPKLGHLAPSQFLPVAEETGLIAPLGEWVLRRACTDFSEVPGVPLAVNLSPVQLRDRTLPERVLEIAREAGLPPERLQLEITESAVLNADAATVDGMRRLRAAGVCIALDDFGTGYSSLTLLRNLEVDKVKIDRSFVQYLEQSADSAAIVQAVANIGHTLGLMVTAEGVETQAQRRFLRFTACTELQGFLFSRPRSKTSLFELMGIGQPVRPALHVA